MDRLLEKTSLEVCRLIKEEHTAQLHESKGKMAALEANLKTSLQDDGKFNEIAAKIFDTTEKKKNKIISKQTKKLEALQNRRNISVEQRTKNAEPEKSKVTKAKPKKKAATSNNASNNKFLKKWPRNAAPSNNKEKKRTARDSATSDDQTEKNASQNQKNFRTLDPVTKKTYAEVAKQGAVPHPLHQSINTLITFLQDLQRTGVSNASPTDGNGRKKNDTNNKSYEGRRQC